VNLVADHHLIVGDFLLLESLLTDSFLADLAAQDLCSDVVLAGENEFHLVEDEVDLFLVLK